MSTNSTGVLSSIKTDVLVIGSGISGLSYAIKLAQEAPNTKITVVTKTKIEECNTAYAQGGIAAVTNFEKDSYNKHIQDTLLAGDYLCDEKIVKLVVSQGPERIEEIIQWGAEFDRGKTGDLSLGREGGHSENRVIHHKDITGFEILRTLISKAKKLTNIQLLEYHYVIDIITEHHIPTIKYNKDTIRCYGAYILDVQQETILKFTAKITLLSAGGVGHAYKNTTNPQVATGDGIALGYRAKAQVDNMQYVQFHPTALYSKRNGRQFLISEAVRGFGAKLRTAKGMPFMHLYDKREELASRDIVARAIDSEMKRSGSDFVYLDCRHLDKKKFLEHFPNIYEKCKEEGIDCFKEMMPVVPSQHYMCGGILVDEYTNTSIRNLQAVGECTCTGLHGANRLASNSLLEGLVFGHIGALETVRKLKEDAFYYKRYSLIPEWNATGMKVADEMVLVSYLKRELQAMMSDLVGIVRSDFRLRLALKKETEIYEAVLKLYKMSVISPQLSDLRNLISVAYLIIRSSLQQTENRGVFYNQDLSLTKVIGVLPEEKL